MDSVTPLRLSEWLDQVDGWLQVRVARSVAPCLATAVLACSIVTLEALIAHRHRQSYLVFNLFLAWIPLGFAILSYRLAEAGRIRSLWFGFSSLGWLLFLPNAPYLFTDLVHLLGKSLPYYWTDMIKILLFASSGTLAGMLSLQIMHAIVTRRMGWWVGWAFVLFVSILCAIGVALGRFNRWNSWDMLHDPTSILKDIVDLTRSPYVNHTNGWFCVLFSGFFFCLYSMVYSSRHAPEAVHHPMPLAPTMNEEKADAAAPQLSESPDAATAAKEP